MPSKKNVADPWSRIKENEFFRARTRLDMSKFELNRMHHNRVYDVAKALEEGVFIRAPWLKLH